VRFPREAARFHGEPRLLKAAAWYPSGEAFNYPQVVATEIRFGASRLAEMNRV
jgi:hypothetical protein